MSGDLLNHVRNCIRKQIKTCLMGCKYYNVYCGAMERYCGDEHVKQNKAAVNVRLGTESVEPVQSRGIGQANKTRKVHKLQLILEVYAVGCEEVEFFVDSICAEVQRKMCNCIQEGEACHTITYQGTEPDRFDLGDKDFHLCRIFYEVTYIADGCNMSEFKPMGCK